MAYDALVAVMGEDWVRSTGRPYLMERPVLMALVATGGLQLLVGIALLTGRLLAARARRGGLP